MDLVETGVIAFVAFVFIGGSMAYFAGPPTDLEDVTPSFLGPEPCGDECRDDSERESEETTDDDRSEGEESDSDERDREKGSGKGKRGKD